MSIQKKSLEQVLNEKCSPDCVPQYLNEFIKTLVEDNRAALNSIKEKEPLVYILILTLMESSYCSGFSDAMRHVIATLIKEDILSFTQERN